MAITAAVAGCGDSDEDASSAGDAGTASSLTKAEYITKANAICTRRQRKILKDLSAYSLAYRKRHPNKRASAHAFPGGLRTVGIAGMQAQLNELRALGRPSDDQGEAEAYLEALEGAIFSVRERPRTSGDQFLRDFRKSRDLARDYGIGACAFG
jgi:hypothetical protein